MKIKIDDYKDLEAAYISAKSICDPVDFAQRQKILIHKIAELLLTPYYDKLESEKNTNEN